VKTSTQFCVELGQC